MVNQPAEVYNCRNINLVHENVVDEPKMSISQSSQQVGLQLRHGVFYERIYLEAKILTNGALPHFVNQTIELSKVKTPPINIYSKE